jgi:hypothetical protein
MREPGLRRRFLGGDVAWSKGMLGWSPSPLTPATGLLTPTSTPTRRHQPTQPPAPSAQPTTALQPPTSTPTTA